MRKIILCLTLILSSLTAHSGSRYIDLEYECFKGNPQKALNELINVDSKIPFEKSSYYDEEFDLIIGMTIGNDGQESATFFGRCELLK